MSNTTPPESESESESDTDVPKVFAVIEDTYSDATVADLKAAVRNAAERDGLPDTALEACYTYERAHKDRVTLTRWLADRLADRDIDIPDGGPPTTDETTDDDTAAAAPADHSDTTAMEQEVTTTPSETEHATADDETTDETADETTTDETTDETTADGHETTDETTMVTIRAPATGYYGGVWFDDAGAQNVEWSSRLAAPVRAGQLELVAVRDDSVLPEDIRP